VRTTLCFGSCCIQVLSIALLNNGEQTRKIMQQQLAVQCVVNLQPQNGTRFLPARWLMRYFQRLPAIARLTNVRMK
jgi:hypothetical protein